MVLEAGVKQQSPFTIVARLQQSSFTSRLEAKMLRTFHFFFNLFNFLLCALLIDLHFCLCEDVGSLGTGVTDSCKLLCGCWELNSGPLEDIPY